MSTIKLKRQEECEQIRTSTEKKKHCLIFSRETFYITTVLCFKKQLMINSQWKHTPVYTHPFNGPLSRITRMSRYQKGTTNLDFTEARDSEWQWHQLGHVQVCTLLQTDNHTSIPPLSFLQAWCPFCHPTNSIKALKANEKSVNESSQWTYC